MEALLDRLEARGMPGAWSPTGSALRLPLLNRWALRRAPASSVAIRAEAKPFPEPLLFAAEGRCEAGGRSLRGR
jgi:hypothetical protein